MRVAEEDEVALGRPELQFVEEDAAVAQAGPAVYREYGGVFPSRLIAQGLHDPALHGHGGAGDGLDGLGDGELEGVDEGVVRMREALFRAVYERIELAGPHAAEGEVDEPARRRVEEFDAALAREDAYLAGREVEGLYAARALDGGDAVERIAVHAPGAARAEAAVCAHRGAHAAVGMAQQQLGLAAGEGDGEEVAVLAVAVAESVGEAEHGPVAPDVEELYYVPVLLQEAAALAAVPYVDAVAQGLHVREAAARIEYPPVRDGEARDVEGRLRELGYARIGAVDIELVPLAGGEARAVAPEGDVLEHVEARVRLAAHGVWRGEGEAPAAERQGLAGLEGHAEERGRLAAVYGQGHVIRPLRARGGVDEGPLVHPGV